MTKGFFCRAGSLMAVLCLLLAMLPGCQGQKDGQAEEIMGDAMLAYQCFVQFSVRVDQTITGEVEIDGRAMRPVLDERFPTLASLEEYARRYFSDEICADLLEKGHYYEKDGRLYSDNFDYAIDPTIVEVNYSETAREPDLVRYEARVTHARLDADGSETERYDESYEYRYEKTNRGWLFTSFPYFWLG